MLRTIVRKRKRSSGQSSISASRLAAVIIMSSFGVYCGGSDSSTDPGAHTDIWSRNDGGWLVLVENIWECDDLYRLYHDSMMPISTPTFPNVTKRAEWLAGNESKMCVGYYSDVPDRRVSIVLLNRFQSEHAFVAVWDDFVASNDNWAEHFVFLDTISD
ncbi:hypothetical protein ACFLRO_01010 [Bacteroidota bacterium]